MHNENNLNEIGAYKVIYEDTGEEEAEMVKSNF